MGVFATGTALNGLHHYGGGKKEGQVSVLFRLYDRRKHFHLIKHSQKGVKQSIEGKKGIRQGNPANNLAGNISLIPLIPR
jgi:hypothetical protein